jgi:hypothetical protein
MESPVSKEEVSKDVKEELKKVEDEAEAKKEEVVNELTAGEEKALNDRLKEEEKVASKEKEDEEKVENLLKQLEKENESKLAVNQRKTAVLEVAEVASYTVIAIELLQVGLKGVEFFAEVGASLPFIGVALKAIAVIGKQIKGHYELHKLLDELKVILQQLQKLLELIQFVYNTFRDEIRKFYTERVNKMRETKSVKLQDMIKLMDELKELFKIKLHPEIELKVKEKLKVVVNILNSIKGTQDKTDTNNPVTENTVGDNKQSVVKSRFATFTDSLRSAAKTISNGASYVKRTAMSLAYASTYKDEILESMIFENSLMFLYHSQYMLVIHEYEEALRKIEPLQGTEANELCTKDGNALIEYIWDKIKEVKYENGKKVPNAYNDYLVDNDDDASISTSASQTKQDLATQAAPSSQKGSPTDALLPPPAPATSQKGSPTDALLPPPPPAPATSQKESATVSPSDTKKSFFSFLGGVGRSGGKRKSKRREKRPMSKTKKNLRGKTKKCKYKLKKRQV